MPYVIGIMLSLSVALFARRVGFDRDQRLSHGTIVIASYYVLFAATSHSLQTLLLESMVMVAATCFALSSSPQ